MDQTISNDNDTLSEMAIVDTVTQLILDVDSALSSRAELVIDLLEQFDPETAELSRQELSEYLFSWRSIS